jgi:hypothetical protein
MKCEHCKRYYTPARVAALGTEPGYCQPSCTKRAIEAASKAFQEWFDRSKNQTKAA